MDSRFEGTIKIYKYPLRMVNTQTLILKGDPLSVVNQKSGLQYMLLIKNMSLISIMSSVL